eukprot:scaffold108084_cov29-Tisochrysis_lutea.AAC.3
MMRRSEASRDRHHAATKAACGLGGKALVGEVLARACPSHWALDKGALSWWIMVLGQQNAAWKLHREASLRITSIATSHAHQIARSPCAVQI